MARERHQPALWEIPSEEQSLTSFPPDAGRVGEYLPLLEHTSFSSYRYLQKSVARFIEYVNPGELTQSLLADFCLRSAHRHLEESIYDPACGYGTLLLTGYRHKEAEDPTLKPSEIFQWLNGSAGINPKWKEKYKMEIAALRLRLRGWSEGHPLPALDSLASPPYDVLSSLTIFPHPLPLLKHLKRLSHPHSRYALLIPPESLLQPSLQQELFKGFLLQQVILFSEPCLRKSPAGILMEHAPEDFSPLHRDASVVQFILLKKSLKEIFPCPSESWEQERARLKEVDYFLRRMSLKKEFFEDENSRIFPISRKRLEETPSCWLFYLTASSLALQMWESSYSTLAPLSEFGDLYPLSEVPSLSSSAILLTPEGRFYPFTPLQDASHQPPICEPADVFILKVRRPEISLLCQLWNSTPCRYLFLQQVAAGVGKKRKSPGEIRVIHPECLGRRIREQLKLYAPSSSSSSSTDLPMNDPLEALSEPRWSLDAFVITEIFQRSADDLLRMRVESQPSWGAQKTRIPPSRAMRKEPEGASYAPTSTSGWNFPLFADPR